MDCSICLNEITKATGQVTTSCGHSFHFHCLSSWFAHQVDDDIPQSCPMCRHEAVEEERHSVVSLEDEDDDESYESESLASEDNDENPAVLPHQWIQQVYQGWVLDIPQAPAAENPPPPQDQPLDQQPQDEEVNEPLQVRICWTRNEDGTWTRRILIGPPPAPAAALAPEARVASKIQALWRGHKARTTYRAARLLLSLIH